MIPPKCDGCTHRCIPGRGPTPAPVMLVGEAPGKDEERTGVCWVGKAGQELENYLTRLSRLDLESVYLTNLVKFHPPGDRDPTAAEIEQCVPLLGEEIRQVNPRVIGALGGFSTRYFLGKDAALERVHGIPHTWGDVTVVPIYHPAAGMHNTNLMIQIAADFEALGKVVRGEVVYGTLADPIPHPVYNLVETRRTLGMVKYAGTVAVDTESVKELDRDGRWWGKTKPWCLSFSTEPGTAQVVMADNHECVALLSVVLADPKVTTLIHNAMYDLPILASMGIAPEHYYDTMVMAYLTQSLPQGLKDLAYRLQGMAMRSYEEVVAEAGRRNAQRYLEQVGGVEWGTPEPELTWAKGEPHVKVGWPLEKRVRKIVTDSVKNPNTDLWDRWHTIDQAVRKPAEARFGLMPIGDLSEVEREQAVQYSARDADATLRVFPGLWAAVEGMNIDK